MKTRTTLRRKANQFIGKVNGHSLIKWSEFYWRKKGILFLVCFRQHKVNNDETIYSIVYMFSKGSDKPQVVYEKKFWDHLAKLNEPSLSLKEILSVVDEDDGTFRIFAKNEDGALSQIDARLN